jgi:FkbM family methyltransferase
MEDDIACFPGRRYSGVHPSMLRKKIVTAYRLLHDGGVKNLYEHSRLMWKIKTKAYKPEVRLNRSTFNLDRITDFPTKVELIMNKYEAPERHAVARYVRQDLPVVELGGSMGVVACVTNRLLKNRTAHVVVEANPLVIPQLELNRTLNRCQFEIVNRAIAYDMESVTFRPSSNVCVSSITAVGDQPSVTVQTTQLSEIVRNRGFTRFNLICDIEGLEYDLVCREIDVLKNADTIILETHARFIGEDKCRLMMSTLEDAGFRIVKEIGYVVVLRQTPPAR